MVKPAPRPAGRGARTVVRRIGNSLGFTLPKRFVDEQGLRPGDNVEVTVKKVRTVAEMRGCLKEQLKGISVDEIMRLIDEGEDLG